MMIKRRRMNQPTTTILPPSLLKSSFIQFCIQQQENILLLVVRFWLVVVVVVVLSLSINNVIPITINHRSLSTTTTIIGVSAQNQFESYNIYHHHHHHPPSNHAKINNLQLPRIRRRSYFSNHNPNQQSIRFVSSSSSVPWRYSSPGGRPQQSSSNSAQQRRAEYYRTVAQNTPDYSNRIIDSKTFQSDRRCRIYNVNLKRRKPNELSWTTRIIWFTVGTFVVQMIRPSITPAGMKLSSTILAGQQLYRLVTPIFLHGGIFHLMTNMGSLARMGNDIEPLFGPSRYLLTYVTAGIMGNIVSSIQSPNPSLGASGAVFGIMGAYYTYINQNEYLLGSYGRSMNDALIQTAGMNILLGLLNPQIDQWAHFGGAIGGAAMTYLLGPRLYVLETPVSLSSSSRGGPTIIVDRPIYRLPDAIETFPTKVSQNIQRALSKLNPSIIFPGNNSKPWQQQQQQQSKRRSIQQQQQFLDRNRSLKPGPVD